MPSTSEIILSNKTAADGSSLTSFEGEKFKGDGYYGRSDGFHTVQYDFSGLSGDIIIQATIATNPTNDDWFDVHTYTANVETATKYHNFTGNFVWIRAKLSITDGTVNSIRMNH